LVEILFLAPALLVFFVFFIYPTSTSLWFSFTNWNGIGKNYHFVGLDNYVNLFTNQDIFQTIPTTGYYALLNTLMLSVFGFLAALALNRQAWVTNLLRVAFFTPMLIAGVIVGFVFQEMYAPVLNEENMGIINRLLTMVGLDSLRASWLGNTSTAMVVVVLTGVWNQVGQTALIYLAAMQIIPGELYESAEMDGAGYWSKTWHITWKMVAPAFTLNMVLLLINSLKQYDMIELLTQGGPGLATRVINIAILDYSISSFKVGLGCAMAMVVTLFVFLTVLLINSILRKRENRGNE
jgi:ABC-type sugar transport system permease subunit